VADARAHCARFFTWYNTEHHHSGIGMMTPERVHVGRAEEIREQRQVTLNPAFLANPSRFKNKRPQPPRSPTAAWINPPNREKNRA
jgi:putative transposase